MKTNRLKAVCIALLPGLAAALMTSAASAQQSVAQLKQLTGNVLVSRAAGMAAGAELQQIANGTRIITTANSEVLVVFDNGCEVRVRENQSFEVDSSKPCAALVPLSLAVAQPAIAAPLAGYLIPALVGGGAIAGGGGGSGPPPTPVSPN